MRTSRGRRGRGGPAGSGSLGSGTHSAAPGPRAPRARCVLKPARKARRAGTARLRAATSPPPPPPWGFGRQGAGAGGTGVHGGPAGANPADRCPGRLSGRRPGPRDACVGGRPSHTGWKKLWGIRATTAMAMPAGRVSPARSAWTEGLEAAGGRWGAPGRAILSERAREASGLGTRHPSLFSGNGLRHRPLPTPGQLSNMGGIGVWGFLQRPEVAMSWTTVVLALELWLRGLW